MTYSILEEWQKEIERILTPTHNGDIKDASREYRERADMAYRFIERNAARIIAAILVLKGESCDT